MNNLNSNLPEDPNTNTNTPEKPKLKIRHDNSSIISGVCLIVILVYLFSESLFSLCVTGSLSAVVPHLVLFAFLLIVIPFVTFFKTEITYPRSYWGKTLDLDNRNVRIKRYLLETVFFGLIVTAVRYIGVMALPTYITVISLGTGIFMTILEVFIYLLISLVASFAVTLISQELQVIFFFYAIKEMGIER